MAPPAVVEANTPAPPLELSAPVPAPWPMSISPEPLMASMASPTLVAEPAVTPAVSMVIVPAPEVVAETPTAPPTAGMAVLALFTFTAPPRAMVMSLSVPPVATTP